MKTRSYRVRWEIDVEAESPKAAAMEALIIQRADESIATFFEVTGPSGKTVEIDLSYDKKVQNKKYGRII
jgi:hypothetical protein